MLDAAVRLLSGRSSLQNGLEAGGHTEAAAELRTGLGCLNGLTDGWGLFLESIERVRAAHAPRFSRDERNALETIRAAARQAVRRR